MGVGLSGSHRSERRAHVPDARECGAERAPDVEAQDPHEQRAQPDQADVEDDEREHGPHDPLRHHGVVEADREDGPGVDELPQLAERVLEDEEHADHLHPAPRRPRHPADEEQGEDDDDRERRPHLVVRRPEPGRRDDGRRLEGPVAEGVPERVVADDVPAAGFGRVRAAVEVRPARGLHLLGHDLAVERDRVGQERARRRPQREREEDGREPEDGPVRAQLLVFRDRRHVAPEQPVVEREVHSRQHHKRRDHPVDVRRAVLADAPVLGREPAGRHRRERVVDRVEQRHGGEEQDHLQRGQGDVDRPQPLGRLGHARRQLVRRWPGHLGLEQLHPAHA